MEEEQVYENNYSNIVLSGGGVKGLIHIGVLQILEENNILKKLNKFCGSSIGSLLCLLLNLELNVRDIETLFLCVDSTKFIDFNPENIINLMDNLGCESSDSIENIIKIILEKKTNNPLITFKELHELTGKELTVVGTSIEEYKAYYFNWKNTPDVSVCEGIMISLCVPFIFEPRKYNGKMFVDEDTADYTYSNNLLTVDFGNGEVEEVSCSFTATDLSITLEETMDTAWTEMGIPITVSIYWGQTIHCSRNTVINTNVSQRIGENNHSWFVKPKFDNIIKSIKK